MHKERSYLFMACRMELLRDKASKAHAIGARIIVGIIFRDNRIDYNEPRFFGALFPQLHPFAQE